MSEPSSFMAERYKFRNRTQQVGETVLQYLSELKRLSKHCDFKSTLEENLRDQFVYGVHEGIREKLFVEQNVMYRDVVIIACAIEEEDSVMSKDSNHPNLDGEKPNCSTDNQLLGNEKYSQAPKNSESDPNNPDNDQNPKNAEEDKIPKNVEKDLTTCSKYSEDSQTQNYIPDDQAPNNAQHEQTPQNAQNLQVPENAQTEQLFSTLSVSQRELREKVLREEDLTVKDIAQCLQDPDLVTIWSIAAREARKKTQKDEMTTLIVISSMIEAGIINSLVNALDKNDCQPLQYEAVQVIANITSKPYQYERDLVEAGVIPKLIPLVGRGEELAEPSLDALNKILRRLGNTEIREAMLDAGVLRVLLPRMTPHTHINMLRKTVDIFRLLCGTESSLKFEYLAPALPYVAELLLATDKKVLCGITMALYFFLQYGGVNLIEEVQNTPQLLPRLVALLNHNSADVKYKTLHSVLVMLRGGTDIQRERCLDAGCLPLLYLLLDSNELELAYNALRAITCILSGTETQIQRAMHSGVLTHLHPLLTKKGYKEEAASVITKVCRSVSREHTDALLRSECFESFCALLSDDNDTASYVMDGLYSIIQAGEKNGLIDDIVIKLKDIGVLELLSKLEESKWPGISLTSRNLIEILEPLIQQ